MPANGRDKAALRLTDGQFGWSGGVQSDTPRTKVIPGVLDEGVQVNQLAWLINGSVRKGGISQRPVLQPLVQGQSWSGLYQGGYLYEPDYADPHLLLQIGGRFYRVNVDSDDSVIDLSDAYGLTNPADQPQAFLRQAEMFAVFQAGDLTTLPVFYDAGVEGVRAASMRRSLGITNPGVSDPANEIPAATCMCYHGHRLWYAYGRGYAAGDIVRNRTSGSAPYDYRDSVLKLTENPVAYGGDAFQVPTMAGNIRSLDYTGNLDTALNQSPLFVGTRKAVYSADVPITRNAWTAADLDTTPLQKVAISNGGPYSDRSVVSVNGDLFFQSPPNGDIRSILTAQRSWDQWGSVPLSTNISRLLQFNDRSLMRYSTGIESNNRLLMANLPIEIPGVGTGFRALAPLNFDVISTFQERRPPAWEGAWDLSGGPYILQLFEGDFGGRNRTFAAVWSVLNQAIEVWELRDDLRFENGENRVTWIVEFPAYAFGDPFGLKQLDSGEIWLDKVLGTVDIEVFYRPDSFACWQKWWAFQNCAAKDCREDTTSPCEDNGYPTDQWCEQDVIPLALPKPPYPAQTTPSGRPADIGYQFQVRLVIKGWCRLRGIILYANWKERRPYLGIQGPTPTLGIE